MLIAALTLLLLGTALAMRGLIGRRVGDEPRCRKCKYNLTGHELPGQTPAITTDDLPAQTAAPDTPAPQPTIAEQVCPECGHPWSAGTAVYGLRKWRVGLLVAAVPFLIAGGAMLLPPVRGWIGSPAMYRVAPEWYVIHAARRGSLLALREIDNRFASQDLTVAGTRKVIAMALANHAPAGTPATYLWADLLDRMESGGALTEPERSAYFSRFATLQFETRPQLRGYDKLPYRLSVSASPIQWRTQYVSAEIQSVTAGSEKLSIEFGRHPQTRALFGDRCLETQTIRSYLKQGRYDLEIKIALKFYGSRTDDSRSTPRFIQQMTFHRPLEVLDQPGSDSLAILNDPDLADSFKQAITLSICGCSFGAGSPRHCIQFKQVASVRCPAIFWVSAETANGKQELGPLRVANAPDPCFEFFQDGRPSFLSDVFFTPGESVTFHLRSTADLARQTTDMTETWVGELTLDPVTVGDSPCK